MTHQTRTTLSIGCKYFESIGEVHTLAHSRCSIDAMNINHLLRYSKSARPYYQIAVAHYSTRAIHYKPTEPHHTRPILGALGTWHLTVECQSRSLNIYH